MRIKYVIPLFILGGMFAAAPPSAADRAAVDAILVRFADAPAMTVNCVECYWCGVPNVYRWDDLPIFLPYEGVDTGGCWEDDCPEDDCPFEADPAEMGQLWAAMQVVEGDELRTLLAFYSSQIEYVAARDVFHFSSCDALVGQIPATPAQIATME